MHPERRATRGNISSPDRQQVLRGQTVPITLSTGKPPSLRSRSQWADFLLSPLQTTLRGGRPASPQGPWGPQFRSAHDLRAVSLTGEAGPTRHRPCPLGLTPGHSTALHRAKTSASPRDKSQLSQPVSLSPEEWFPHGRDNHLLEAVKVLELNTQQVLTQRLVPRAGMTRADTTTGLPSGARRASQPTWPLPQG